MMSAPAFDLSLLRGSIPPPGAAPAAVGTPAAVDFATLILAAPPGDVPAIEPAPDPAGRLDPAAVGMILPDLMPATKDEAAPEPAPVDPDARDATIDPAVLAWLSPPIVQVNVPPPAARFRLIDGAPAVAAPSPSLSPSPTPSLSPSPAAVAEPGTSPTPLTTVDPATGERHPARDPAPEAVATPPAKPATAVTAPVGEGQRLAAQTVIVPTLVPTARAPATTASPPDKAIAKALRAGPVVTDGPALPPAAAAPIDDTGQSPRPLAFVLPAAVVVAGDEGRSRPTGEPLLPSAPVSLAPAPAPGPAPVAATAAPAIHTGIDLRQAAGVERMIDHIERLRDDAATHAESTRSTRISLSPDSLGRVEVSVHREGDAVRVHFTATESATRQLLADARPQLTELAEARGVRIERATVGSDAGQADARGQHQHSGAAPAPPRAPARARAGVADDAVSDTRIA